jgi:hypothetical protein
MAAIPVSSLQSGGCHRSVSLSRTHHRFRPPTYETRMNQRTPCASTGEFFNTIRQKQSFELRLRSIAA